MLEVFLYNHAKSVQPANIPIRLWAILKHMIFLSNAEIRVILMPMNRHARMLRLKSEEIVLVLQSNDDESKCPGWYNVVESYPICHSGHFSKPKIYFMKNLVLLFFCFVVVFGCKNSTQCEKEIYLIPQGYRGKLIVFFDQPDGKPIQYEKDSRIYCIPLNGFLKTRFKKNVGCMSDNRIIFYYADSVGNRTHIDYFLDLDRNAIPKYKDYVMFTFLSNKNSKPDFVIHLIGSVYEFKELTNSVKNLEPEKILKSL